jgi:glycosyltransferase involved in cell wall biosynthesis
MAPDHDPTDPSTCGPTLRAVADRRDDRPIAFLVSTTSCARSIRDTMGSPAYSYYFVLEALAPALDALGTWTLVDHPESRLSFAAAKARAAGARPVHLAINPLQDVYLSPDVPNVVFPFWEFPEIPDRDFGYDTRQNWLRVCRPASLVMTACEFTAAAFRAAGVKCPVAVVPIPVPSGAFDLPDHDPAHTWTLTCRHEVLGPPAAVAETTTAMAAPEPAPEPRGGPIWRAARGGFRRVMPWIDPQTVGRIVRFRHTLARARRLPQHKAAYAAVRSGYRRHVRPWLSAEALDRVSATRKKALAALGHEPTVVPDPPLPSGPLTLGGGLTYLTIFNLGDRRKNHLDLISSFLLAFRDRPDATLVIKLVTNSWREHYETNVLRYEFRKLGITHKCRVVMVTEFLSESQMDELFRVSTYYVNASHAEGACLPLMRALAGGRPAIAPRHTAMADYMDDSVGFVPRTFPEPTYWPHDPEQRLETFRYRPVWSDLRNAFLASAEAADRDPARYAAMARAARARMAAYASRSAAESALRSALDRLPDEPPGALGWAC